ncbi:MAG: hypothetical protein LBU73_10140 [Helicobacteraceae bacterium]|nr:hypothetical protein [Helicobacteraceae bacterium]
MKISEVFVSENELKERLGAVSDWAFRNAPAILAVAIAAALTGVAGLVTGLAIYALLSYYKHKNSAGAEDSCACGCGCNDDPSQADSCEDDSEIDPHNPDYAAQNERKPRKKAAKKPVAE